MTRPERHLQRAYAADGPGHDPDRQAGVDAWTLLLFPADDGCDFIWSPPRRMVLRTRPVPGLAELARAIFYRFGLHRPVSLALDFMPSQAPESTQRTTPGRVAAKDAPLALSAAARARDH